MIVHKDFESDCKRIAKDIMRQATDTQSDDFADIISTGSVSIIVSEGLLGTFNAEWLKDSKKRKEETIKWEKEINKHLKGCSIKYNTVGYDRGWFIKFDIEFDDVDGETEDW